MNIEEYIASGIIERYVHGDVSPQEKQEVECMSHIYPEIKDELDMISMVFEKMAEAQRQPAPSSLKADILSAIDSVDQESTLSIVKESDDKRNQLVTKENNTNRNNWLRIAAVALLLISAGLTALLLSQSGEDNADELAETKKEYRERMDALSKELQDLKSQNDTYLAELELNKAELDILSDPQLNVTRMKGTDLDPSALASMYINPEKKSAYIDTRSLNKLDPEKSYQLWAIVDGKPVDMGILDIAFEQASALLNVDFIENAQAFAITIEPSGGSENPTLEQMIVLGEV